MGHIFPEAVIAVSPFCEEALDMRVPFQVAAECMQDHDESRCIIFGLVQFFEHPEDGKLLRFNIYRGFLLRNIIYNYNI